MMAGKLAELRVAFHLKKEFLAYFNQTDNRRKLSRKSFCRKIRSQVRIITTMEQNPTLTLPL